MTQIQIVQKDRVSCNRKLRLTMEEAAERFGKRPKELTMYICTHCNHVHYGHPFGYYRSAQRVSSTPIADMIDRQRRKPSGRTR